MLNEHKPSLIAYKTLQIYGEKYKLPVLKNTQLKKIQQKIKERRQVIRQGIRCHYYFGKILKKKEKITQQARFSELKLLIQDYILLTNCLETYHNYYYNFLLILSDNLNQFVIQKYQELKMLDYERINLELKNKNNPIILDQLNYEKQENLKATLLLGQTSFLMLEKLKLLGNGIENLREDTKKQKQIIQKVLEKLEVYEEINNYKQKAEKVRQEIANLAQNTLDFNNYLQDFFNPFYTLIDQAIKIDEEFYGIVAEIQELFNNIFDLTINESNLKQSDNFSDLFFEFMINSYQKTTQIKEACLNSKLLNQQVTNFELPDKLTSLEPTIEELSNYLSNQFITKQKLWQTKTEFLTSLDSKLTQEQPKSKSEISFSDKTINNIQINYTKLGNLLKEKNWKEADLETSDLLLKVMGKSYWNEVYPEDIKNFSCQAIRTIDQLWVQYSKGYFGFTIQESIWSQIGGQEDYETEKKFGELLGWRKEGNWLQYEQLTFELSSITPIGHLPVNWLTYHQPISSLSSTEISSMGAWRVDSWLLWQMHLFLSRVRSCRTLLR
ncbi:GUN4 domain-containing protein [Aphanothece sacrum]|uniref:Serine/threonine protein kinase n=1 Tax=Aphanothece sacrum FPU1 TaxID=1920663 RepID=A0A401IGD4_APHSA|nr:GUN4 domain-containing protein [Aphanothece sacrum]GBF80250.1 serine/threonine protein kinase [Aphanothece sacrum FPU1]GBF83655.1 serine/threonine protein kinase [Aphanothece sacrum FPU3]